MEEVREQLRRGVREISDKDIARLAFPGAHSIGALVLHIGEAEWFWMEIVITGHKLTDEDRARPFWDVLKDKEKFDRLNLSAQKCLSIVDEIRDETRSRLSSFRDDQLDEASIRSERRGQQYEFSLRWILHHLIDHEAQHKGQILMLKRLLTGRTKEF
jgi:uncharacterized damage-inducible protein DinB